MLIARDEARQRVRPFLADDFFPVHDAGAIDESLQAAEAVDRGGDRRLAARLIGHVGLHEAHGAAKFRCQRGAHLRVDIGQHDVATTGDDHSGRRGAQAGRSARDDERAVLQIHWLISLAP